MSTFNDKNNKNSNTERLAPGPVHATETIHYLRELPSYHCPQEKKNTNGHTKGKGPAQKSTASKWYIGQIKT